MIQKGQVVALIYTLTDPDGEELDRSDAGEPFSYLHGYGQIVSGLEKAVETMKVGDKKTVVVEPEEGYGERDESLQMTIKRSAFPGDATLEKGMQFEASLTGDSPARIFTITDIKGETVNIDGNHPLAGETLHFEIEVAEIREATDEEKSHGHVHGSGGHHDH